MYKYYKYKQNFMVILKKITINSFIHLINYFPGTNFIHNVSRETLFNIIHICMNQDFKSNKFKKKIIFCIDKYINNIITHLMQNTNHLIIYRY